jgi:hypothetical protein
VSWSLVENEASDVAGLESPAASPSLNFDIDTEELAGETLGANHGIGSDG